MMAEAKPLLIYDGDCNFCRRWITRWRGWTKEAVEYAPSRQVAGRFPEIPPQKFQASVQLVEPDGKIFSGAEAVFKMLAYAPQKRWMFWVYENIPGFRPVTEWFYRFVASHRIAFSRLTNFFWGKHLEPSTYVFTSWLFLRLPGAIYLIAFVSIGVQIKGLVGINGILPAQSFLQAVGNQIGPERYWLLPTLGWLKSSDGFLQFLCWGGAFLSLLLILDIAPVFLLFLLWLFYLSLVNVCQDFLSFQWDILLLEAGFLAIFLAAFHLLPKFPLRHRTPPPNPVLWLLRWLLFRLVFSSGVIKLASHDAAWRSLTALNFHYETQPLPTWVGWFAHQLPPWFQNLSVVNMFVIELAVPFLIFAPRRLRLFGCALLILFQGLIMVTGNYCFFNLLTIALCLLLIDDAAWPGLLWGRVDSADSSSRTTTRARCWPNWILVPLMVLIFLISSLPMTAIFRRRMIPPFPVVVLYQLARPFYIVNGYGLFAVMTTSRPEIIIEGSQDGTTWLAYEFKWKPGNLSRKPGFVEPHQPRLDWQMWFAALGDYRENPWFMNFIIRLMQGSPEVLALMAKNPFPDGPPQKLRATVYDYHFTDIPTLQATGVWWKRTRKGLYCPVLMRSGTQIFLERE